MEAWSISKGLPIAEANEYNVCHANNYTGKFCNDIQAKARDDSSLGLNHGVQQNILNFNIPPWIFP